MEFYIPGIIMGGIWVALVLTVPRNTFFLRGFQQSQGHIMHLKAAVQG